MSVAPSDVSDHVVEHVRMPIGEKLKLLIARFHASQTETAHASSGWVCC